MRLQCALAVLVVLVAGCTGTFAEVHSAPATIPDAALTPVDYVHGNTTEVPLTYPVGVGPVSRDVTVYVWVSGYAKTVENAETGQNDTAGLLLVSSPNRRVEGQSVNPFAQLSNRELVAQLFELVVEAGAATRVNVTEVAELREVGVQNRTILGQRTEVVSYEATVRISNTTPAANAPVSDADAGEEVTIVIHLAVVEHGEDVVLALGVHSDELDEGEAMAGLMQFIEHETTVPSPTSA